MEVDTRDNSKILSSMEQVHKDSEMEKLLLEVIKETDRTEKESIIGPMETITKAFFQTV